MLVPVMCNCGGKNSKPHVDHYICDKCGSFEVYSVEFLRKRKKKIWWETPVVSRIVLNRETRLSRFCPWCGEPYKRFKTK